MNVTNLKNAIVEKAKFVIVALEKAKTVEDSIREIMTDVINF